MSEVEEERAGLVKTHAYAVLSMVEVKGVKLLQLKNPWSHRRWKVKETSTTVFMRILIEFCVTDFSSVVRVLEQREKGR